MSGADESPVEVEVAGLATLPTRFGEFRIHVFSNNRDHEEHVAMVRGDVAGAQSVACRVHSECLTGDAMGSLRCDCGAQLERSLEQLATSPRAVLLYMRREACSTGVATKILEYALRDRRGDARIERRPGDEGCDYGVAAAMLRALDVRSVRLPATTSEAIHHLARQGITVCEEPRLEFASDAEDLDESA
jgi:GTP cyclohydrolase II